MSRLLGHRTRLAKIRGSTASGYELEGMKAFANGVPKNAIPFSKFSNHYKGKAHAWLRGWQRAWIKARRATS